MVRRVIPLVALVWMLALSGALDSWADTEPKTDAGNRTIALTAATVALLREHCRAQLEQRI
jgi:hypothetical protein